MRFVPRTPLLVLILLPLTAPALVAAPPLKVAGAAFPTSECSICLTDEAPVLAGSNAATFLALWFRPTGSQFHSDFLARAFDAAGVAVNQRRINDADPNRQIRASRQTAGSVAAGDFVVLWQHPGQIWAQRTDPLGNPFGGAIFVNQTPAGVDDDHPILQVHPDGSFDVYWINYNFGPNRAEIGVRRVDAANSVSGPRRVDAGALFPSIGSYRSCRLTSGDTVLVWDTMPFAAVSGGPSPPHGVAMRRLDGGGVPVGAEVLLVPTVHEIFGGLQLAVECLSDGSFVLAASTNRAPAKSGFDIVAQRFDGDGNALAAAKVLHTQTKGDQTAPALEAVGAKGEFVAAWVSTVNGKSTVVARRFKSSFATRGPELKVFGPFADLVRAVELEEYGAGGKLVAGWWQGVGAGPLGRGLARLLAAGK